MKNDGFTRCGTTPAPPRPPLVPFLGASSKFNEHPMLFSKGSWERFWWLWERNGCQNGSQMEPKWSQNALRRRCRRGVLVRMRSGLHFGSNFHWFWNCFGMTSRCFFGSSHLVNAKCECSESLNFYNRFWRFYWSDEVRKAFKIVRNITGIAL